MRIKAILLAALATGFLLTALVTSCTAGEVQTIYGPVDIRPATATDPGESYVNGTEWIRDLASGTVRSVLDDPAVGRRYPRFPRVPRPPFWMPYTRDYNVPIYSDRRFRPVPVTPNYRYPTNPRYGSIPTSIDSGPYRGNQNFGVLPDNRTIGAMPPE